MTRFRRLFAEHLAPLVGSDVDSVAEQIGAPPKPDMGQLAFPCFPLAKERRSAPPKIAAELAEQLAGTEIPGIVAIKAVGPYVNAFVDGAAAARAVLPEVLGRGAAFGTHDGGGGAQVPVDFSSPNIAKPFGIHHLRSTVIGHALVGLLTASGYRPVGINHLGDWGTQFGQLLAIWEKKGDEERLTAEGIDYLLALYIEFNELKKDDPSLQDVARDRFKKLEDGDPECRRLWKLFRDVSLAEFERVYALLGIRFDDTRGESFYEDRMGAVLDELESKGLLKESDDATVVDLEEYELGVALVKKRDGSTLYLTRDLAAAQFRWDSYDFPRALYVVGAAQALHFAQMKKVLELMGRTWHDRVDHIPFGMMRFADRKMATRSGDIILLEDVLTEAIALAKETIVAGANEKGRENPDDLDELAHAIGVGAVVFNDLKNRRTRDVVFDWKQVLSFEGETGPYLQYTAARIGSMVAKAERAMSTVAVGTDEARTLAEGIDAAQLAGQDELRLVLAIDGLRESLDRAVTAAEPSLVADKLLEIAARFSTLYSNRDWKVLSDDEATTDARLALARATRQALVNGLDWLGIPVPARM